MYHSTLYLYITVDVNGCGVLYFSSYRYVSLISTQTSRKKPDNEPEREREWNLIADGLYTISTQYQQIVKSYQHWDL